MKPTALVLSYLDRVISFEFAALNYSVAAEESLSLHAGRI